MTDTPSDDFAAFMTSREAAARAYVRGDAEPLRQLSTATDPASFFGPGGGHRDGAAVVTTTYRQGAAAFTADGDTRLEILQSGASAGLAFWTGYQRATVCMHGQPAPVTMDLRVTEVFRREDGRWMLVHRHADRLTTETPRR